MYWNTQKEKTNGMMQVINRMFKLDCSSAEIYNVQPKNDMQCGVGKNNI